VRVSDTYPNGVRFIGDEGWIFVSRGGVRVTASDPVSPGADLKALDASDPKLIAGEIPAGGVRLYRSANHYRNWLECVRGGKEPVVPVETGHRSFSACFVSWVAMKLARPLRWDAKAERFVGDDEANALLSRTERAPYAIEPLMQAFRRGQAG
jgi:myo-inositol 2-dehydrogenase / D-chiro-inositol 1-dehydrogenase